MDFDLSKENIQPLRGGRNVVQLGVALQAQGDMEHQRELLQQKGEFEKLIRTYTGDDPLENWYNYISWVEQSFPKQGHEGNLISLLEHCINLFEHDSRYRDDRRLCKLFIKYIDQQQNPLELYHMMYAQGLCRGCSDMYKAWAYYFEAAGDFQNAHRVFECGKRELAQPYDELQIAHKNLVMAAGNHIIYGPNERELSEKRQALTSLQTYKSGQVFSVRTADFSQLASVGTPVTGRSNIAVSVYEDKGDEVPGAEAAPTSIVTAARGQEVRKENTIKPGPWTTVPVKKKHSGTKSAPLFTVHEDVDESNSNGVKLRNFVSSTSENYSNWIVSLTIPEPKDDKVIPVYPKDKVYSEISTEYSLEELRARRYIPCDKKPVIEISQTNPIQSLLADASLSFSKVKDESKPDQMLYQNSFQQLEQKKPHFQPPTIFTEQPVMENQLTKNTPDRKTNKTQLNFNLWDSFENESPKTPLNVVQKANAPKFSIYEQSNVVLEEHMEPKGSAMKTPFKDLNAEELAETGSRGGMDIAAAAPVDSAKRLPIYDDDSSSYDKVVEPENFEDLTCNTHMFNFNLNAMQVSTPQNKEPFTARSSQDVVNITPKQLFAETIKTQDDKYKVLSTIFEETKSYGLSSSSSTTKTPSFNNPMKQTNMATISEEHNSYLAQNLMVNAALRSSLGDLMDFNNHSSPLGAVPRTSSVLMSTTPPEPVKALPLNFVPSDPFKPNVVESLLHRVNFPGPHTEGYCYINNINKPTVRKESICIGSDRYVIEKQLGKGTYGTVFRGIDVRTGNTVAIKYQRPANKWEFYICRELRARLANHPLKERFMDVKIGYFSEQASVLISEFMPCGSLLDVANLVKQRSGRSMKESLCIHFCLEMLKVVQAMHEVKIIHADVKPDNFLVQLLPNDIIGLHLIDFGCSIDMSLFPPGASFTRKVTTENFICCEMLDNRPWNYHTDLFCVAATAHVLLFEKYIQLQKNGMHWSISNRLPRYARLDLWNMFFSTLLNQQQGPAKSEEVQAMLEDSLNHKFDDYHNELRYLVNILKNR